MRIKLARRCDAEDSHKASMRTRGRECPQWVESGHFPSRMKLSRGAILESDMRAPSEIKGSCNFDSPPQFARPKTNLVFRKQGCLDALDQALPLGRRHPREEVDTGDGQVWLHRRCQCRGGHAGQPRILGLQGRIDRTRPRRIVDDLWGELGKAYVAAPKVAGRRELGRHRPSR